MAFVIFSTGALTRSKPRTLSLGSFVSLAFGGAILTLAAGVALGYGLRGQSEAEASLAAIEESKFSVISQARAAEPDPLAVVDQRILIDRFGELAGRMIRLEAEAFDLATRIGVIKEFESRLTPEEIKAQASGRVARTPPGMPSGGPLILEHGGKSAVQADPAALGLTEADDELAVDTLSRIESDVERMTEVLADLDRAVTSMNLAHMSFPGRTPVRGKAATSAFGSRIDPFSRRQAFHSGVDYPAPTGTPIHASAGGKVIYSGYRPAYGKTVEIDHGAGLVTRYAHASKLLVQQGQVVMPGEKVAHVGSTGRSTGPHLHFEILKDGRFVDPAVYLARF